MSAVAPPGMEKPLRGGKGLPKLTTERAYHALDLLQGPFRFVFWKIEQLKAHLQDRIDNERSGL